ncbi:hypothetical protein [Nocardia brasiliensis]|uniref:hypothetical protein n=1 Tax=Nocardia brasiliensis TaxID=37326 RepID=UPI003404C51C
MSDNTSEPEQISAAASTAPVAVDDYDTEVPAPADLVTATGHGQRIAYLLATAATNQARERGERLDTAIAHARAEGDQERVAALARELIAQTERVEECMREIPWTNREAVAGMLADALVWSRESGQVADVLDRITSSYAQQWGVVINPDTLRVSLDPDFDATAVQDYADASALWARESYAMDIIATTPLTPAARTAVSQAISSWRGEPIDPTDPRAHLRSEATRRELLSVDLADAPLSADERARIEFTVDYLRGDTTAVDLLGSPVLVDPGEEVRGRVPQLLEFFALGQIAGAEVAEYITVMTAEDQTTLADLGRAIRAGHKVDYQVWPGYIDRDAVTDQLSLYADDVAEQRADADYLLADIGIDERERIGVGDDIGERIKRIAHTREQLRAVTRNAQGLASMECAHFDAVLDDIDTGRILGTAQLPELMWVDEHTKADADWKRSHVTAAALASGTREQVHAVIEADNPGRTRDLLVASALRTEVSSISDSIYSVASGLASGRIAEERKSYLAKRDRLDQALTKADMPQQAIQQIRALVDDNARQAGQLGRPAAARIQHWKTKTEQIVTARDDAIAQRQAATAGLANPGPPPRACTTRPELATTPAPATRAAGRRRLHSPELGR